MKATLKDLLVQCLKASDTGGKGLDPGRFPSQVCLPPVAVTRMCITAYFQILCLSEQIRFTDLCEKAIEKNILGSFLEDLKGQLDAYTSTEPGSHVLQLKLKALILDLIHHIDVVEQLSEAKVKSTGAWTWQKQLR